MFGVFENKNEKILNEIKAFESLLNKEFVPLLEKPAKPISGNGALMSMAVNIALYFLLIRKPKVFTKAAPHVLHYVASAFASMVVVGSEGKISFEEAADSMVREMHANQVKYSNALDKSPSNPEGALQECLDIFLESSGGWKFKGEFERSQAVIMLSSELQRLMDRFIAIL